MLTKNYFSLALAALHIKEFRHTHSLTPEQQQFLARIRMNIGAISSTQRGWLKTGLVARASEHPPTQETLVREYQEAQEKTLGFSWITINVLLLDIKAEIEGMNPVNHAYLHLLSNIQKCLAATHANLKSRLNDGKIGLLPAEKDYFSAQSEQLKFIRRMGGRYIPFAQKYDPLFGNHFLGACAGYTLQWIDEIIKQGWSSSLPRVDEQTLYLQKSQCTTVLKCIKDFCKSSIYRDCASSKPLLFKFIDSLDPDRVYSFNVVFLKYRVSHIMGIRQIRGCGSIELFDSNLGIVVFDKPAAFKLWFAPYFEKYDDPMSSGGWMRLYDQGPQGMHARPSIPVLRDNGHCEERSDEAIQISRKRFNPC